MFHVCEFVIIPIFSVLKKQEDQVKVAPLFDTILVIKVTRETRYDTMPCNTSRFVFWAFVSLEAYTTLHITLHQLADYSD